MRRGRNAQGASTLSMQLARDMFLTPARNWRRKMAEIMITLQLEQKLTKQQIFEMYCNQVDLGYRGSFTIRGFGEAANAYFGKDCGHSPCQRPPRSQRSCAGRVTTIPTGIRNGFASGGTRSSL